MDYAKISPTLRASFEEFKLHGTKPLSAMTPTLPLLSLDEPAREPRVLIFIDCTQDANFERLRDECGVVIEERDTEVRTGITPIDAIPAVASAPGVNYVAASPMLRSYIDVGCEKIGLSNLRERYPNPPLDGRGVVVGIVDSGIDPSHPAFFGRINRIWDQTLFGGGGVPEGHHGTELTGHQMHMSRDRVGHGTHVAGIAAGAGLYPGVAPAATLIAVRTATPAPAIHVLQGVRYIFRCAQQLGMPAVVNLSLGHHQGPHDGSDQLSRGVSQASGPGRIVCCAAGNEGLDNIHAESTPSAGSPAEVTLLPAAGTTFITGWHEKAADIGVSVLSPSGRVTEVISDVDVDHSYDFPDGWVRISTASPWRTNARNFEVILRTEGTHPAGISGAWRIVLERQSGADGRADLWIWSSPEPGSRFTGPTASPTRTICQPADADSAIAVAAYTTRDMWIDSTGQRRMAGFPVDEICDFSSEGPRRDGFEKPDLAAPGAVICSCLSHNATIDPDWVIDHERCVMFGTSMAAPFVTGAVALLLQRDPTLDPATVTGMLKAHSKAPGQPAGTYHPKWGYGLVDLSTI